MDRRKGRAGGAYSPPVSPVGPGAFTDATLRYMVARYGIDPSSVSGHYGKAVRVGDVLLYPEYSFQTDDWSRRKNVFELVHHE